MNATLPSRSRRIARSGMTVTFLVTLFGSVALAQVTQSWDGGGADNNWATAGNWSANNVPDTTAEAALFTNDSVGQTKLSPNLAADVVIGQLQYSATAPGYTITGTGPSTLFLSPNASYGGVAVVVASGAANQSITAAEVEFLSSQTWDIGGTTTLLVTGTIEDAPSPDYALTKNGTGTLLFPGDVRYDGPTVVNAGSMVLSFSNTSMLSSLTVNGGLLRGTTSVNALGNNSTRNNITLAGGALELANNTGQTFGSTSRITTVSGNATIRSDRLTAGAGVTHTLGTLRIGRPTLSVAPGAAVTSGTAGMNFGATTFTAAGSVLDVASGANLTLGALGGNFTFTKQGSGQLSLNTAANANRTSALVTLVGGTMRLGSASALGTAAVPMTINGGTLELAINSSINAHSTTIGGNATVVSNRSTAGAGVAHTFGLLALGAQTLTVTPGTNATSGTAGVAFGATTLSGNATVAVVNGGSATAQLTLGAIGESGGARSLTKTGTGMLLLNGAGSYTGGTTLTQGAITLGVANSLGSGGFTFAGGTLNANNTSDSSIGALRINADSTLNLAPGGAAATLTFAGVSGTANGMLTITGWSGSPGDLGTNDKIIISGGTAPNAEFLQHIRFDLGGGNFFPGALGAGGELIPGGGSPVTVPGVVGATQAAATTTLQGAGLNVAASSQSSATVPVGVVISQNPAAGASVPPGTTVQLVVSSGVTVPSVVGATQAAATTTLQTAGLGTSVAQQSSTTIPLGNVIGQNPVAGAQVSGGTVIALQISSGTSVPAVVGQSQAAATTALQNAGLIATVSTAPSATVPLGNVISQNPAAGAIASAGDSVAIVVSTGVVVPDVVGQPQAGATTTLSSAGFAVTTSTQPSSSIATGNVISQNPAGGASASGGSSVALVISSGPPLNVTLLNAQSAQATTSSSTLDLNYTVPANAGSSSLLLVVRAGGEAFTTNNALPASATFHGVALPRAGAIRSTATGSNVGAGLFWLPVTAGETGTIRVTFSGTCQQRALTAVTLVGAVATGPSAVETAAGTGNLSDQIATTGANAMILSTATQSNSGNLTATGTGHIRDVSLALSSSRTVAGHAEIVTASTATLGYSGTITRIAMVLAAFPVAAPTPQVMVPDVTNLAQAAAESALTTAGLQTGTVTTAFHATLPAGIVISQNPAAGASVPGGTAVALVVSLGVEPPPNTPPTVALTAPEDGASFLAPVHLALAANANDSDGTIARVEFFVGTTKLGEVTAAPFEFTWIDAPAGGHTLTARATDDDNSTATSAPVAITINAPPNDLPTVALTAPADGIVFTAPVNIDLTADAGDTDGTVAKVEFFADATKLGEDLSDPYAFPWTNAPAGSHTLTARVTDNAGAVVNSLPVAIVVNPAPNVPPTVALATPFPNAVFTTPTNVTLTATAGDTDGTIAKVEFFSGATKLGEDTTNPYAYTWNSVSAGNYTLTAAATDNRNATTISAPVAIIVNTPPTVALSAPTNNATFTTPVDVTLTATAGDTDGTVALVEFYSGATRLGEDATAPYAFTWLAAPAGAHALTARATDNRGALTASTAVSITITSPTPAGLVAAYAFNEGSGTTTADATGKGHTGTISSATWITTGKNGNALNFAGTARVTVADAADLDFTTAFTISTWVYPTQQSGWASLVMKETSGNLVYALYSGTDGNLPVGVFYSGDYRAAVGPSALPLNTWTHLATTYDGTTIRLFVNGAQVASSAYTGAMGASTGVLSLGGNGVWGEYFRGRLDDVRLYNRALTAAEISTDMNTAVVP